MAAARYSPRSLLWRAVAYQSSASARSRSYSSGPPSPARSFSSAVRESSAYRVERPRRARIWRERAGRVPRDRVLAEDPIDLAERDAPDADRRRAAERDNHEAERERDSCG